MNALASFNYESSGPAAIIGVLMAMGAAAALISSGRPWLAAGIGALSWSALSFVVALAGQGDMVGLHAMANVVIYAPLGAVVCGVGAWIRSRQRPVDETGEPPTP